MAKQPATIDRFRISAETSSPDLGPLLAQLTRMGLQITGCELITDVVRFNKNDRMAHGPSSEEFAIAYIAEHPTFKAIELVNHFREDGRSVQPCYHTIKKLVESGHLKKLGAGNYQRADVKAIPAPPEKKARGQVPPHDVSNETLLLKYIKGRKRVISLDAGAHLEAEGRNKKSASPLISHFVSSGLLKQIEPGVYEVRAKAKLPKASAKATAEHKERDRLRAQARRDAAKKAKLNGQSPGEDAHG